MPLAIYTSAAWTSNGGLSPASQAQVEVRDESTGALASIFSDRAGATGLANPFQADDEGRFSFFVPGGAYKITVTSGGETHTLRYQAVGTAEEHDVAANGGDVATYGQTETASLSSGVLTIPAGLSTIKLPSTVWDGTSNITVSGFAFENGVQPEVGYEFAVQIPRTGVAAAGALGNEVLIQDGASIDCFATGGTDLPCYPNAADNPDTDPVQYAAPAYLLKFRVDSYDGSGDPVVSLIELPPAAFVSNDNGYVYRDAMLYATCWRKDQGDLDASGATSFTWQYPASFATRPAISSTISRGIADSGQTIGENGISNNYDEVSALVYKDGTSGARYHLTAMGEWA